MSALPALTRPYSTRANGPFGANNTSQLRLESFAMWALSAAMLDLHTTGTLVGARHANSKAICRGSSNGVTGSAVTGVGVAGTNRWGGGTFPGNFIRGAGGTNHHWMLVEFVFLGLEVYLDFGSTAANWAVNVAPSGTWSGGTVSQGPAASLDSRVTCLNQSNFESTQSGNYGSMGDSTNFGGTNYWHYTAADSGEFHFECSRAGLGCFFNFVALWKPVNGPVADLFPYVLLNGDTTATVRGSPDAYRMGTATFSAARSNFGVGDTQKSGGGVVTWATDGQSMITNQAIDAGTANWNAIPLNLIESAPQHMRRGMLPDLQAIGNAPVGASIPSAAAQVRVVMGNMVVPFNTTVPLY